MTMASAAGSLVAPSTCSISMPPTDLKCSPMRCEMPPLPEEAKLSAFGFFFAKLRYGADAYDIYGRLIEKMDGQKGKLKFGGDTAVTRPWLVSVTSTMRAGSW